MGTPSHLGHMDRVAATMPSQAHAGAAQEAPDIGQWEGQDVPLVRPSSCNVKGGIPSSRRYLPTYLGRACPDLAPPPRAAIAEFLAQNWDLATPPPGLQHGQGRVEPRAMKRSNGQNDEEKCLLLVACCLLLLACCLLATFEGRGV